MKRNLLFILLFFAFAAFDPSPIVRHNGCYKSQSTIDHTITGLYYLRLYSDGTAIEYEQPGNVHINFDKGVLSKILKKDSNNENFPLKTGKYFIKNSALKINLSSNSETVTYEGTTEKFTLNLERHSTKTNQRQQMEFAFQKIRGF